MVGLQGIGGVPEPANTTQPNGRSKRNESAPQTTAADEALFSGEAVEASKAAQLAQAAKAAEEIRQEKVEQAKENIRNGTYRLQEVVLQVAARVSRFL